MVSVDAELATFHEMSKTFLMERYIVSSSRSKVLYRVSAAFLEKIRDGGTTDLPQTVGELHQQLCLKHLS